MELITDGLLLAASLAAGLYCRILSAKLHRFTALEAGMGGAIAVLSAQVEEMKLALERARAIAAGSEARLEGIRDKSEAAARRVELLVAALHDFPKDAEPRLAVAASPAEQTPQRRATKELTTSANDGGFAIKSTGLAQHLAGSVPVAKPSPAAQSKGLRFFRRRVSPGLREVAG